MNLVLYWLIGLLAFATVIVLFILIVQQRILLYLQQAYPAKYDRYIAKDLARVKPWMRWQHSAFLTYRPLLLRDIMDDREFDLDWKMYGLLRVYDTTMNVNFALFLAGLALLVVWVIVLGPVLL